jgi:hypothetical protein
MRVLKFAHKEGDAAPIYGVEMNDGDTLIFRVESLTEAQLARIDAADHEMWNDVMRLRNMVSKIERGLTPYTVRGRVQPPAIRYDVPDLSIAPEAPRSFRWIDTDTDTEYERSALAEQREGIHDALTEGDTDEVRDALDEENGV